jgi:ATP-binding cassette subfamily F protein uup
VLEEYLASFNGCVAVVTHDRYFLDKIVDHLFVFEGDGVVRDFPGNYTQHKLWSEDRKRAAQLQKRNVVKKEETAKPVPVQTNKLSFREKRELENLETEIEALESEKTAIEAGLASGTLSAEALTKNLERYEILLGEISAKTDRWMELSDRQ